MDILEDHIFYFFASISYILEEDRIGKERGVESDYLARTFEDRMDIVTEALTVGWRSHYKS